MPDRITRTYWLRYPRWRTSVERDTNWLWFRWFDWLPLAAMLIFAPSREGWWYTVPAAWYVFVFPVVLVWRLRRRARACERLGHVPFSPVPDEVECAWCGTPLRRVEGEYVSLGVARAASEVEAARRVSQAMHSDRR